MLEVKKHTHKKKLGWNPGYKTLSVFSPVKYSDSQTFLVLWEDVMKMLYELLSSVKTDGAVIYLLAMIN